VAVLLLLLLLFEMLFVTFDQLFLLKKTTVNDLVAVAVEVTCDPLVSSSGRRN